MASDFDRIESVVFSEKQISRRINELGRQISEDYRDKFPLLIGILRGAFIFLADLARAIHIPCTFDFMAVSSYGSKTKTSGVVRILKDLNEHIQDRHVILVEDIIDTGLTLDYLIRILKARHPASLKTCALLDKKECRKADIQADYTGFTVPDAFMVGYGLDLDQSFRNLPYVGIYNENADA